jgi:deoxyhypusine synthase
MKIVKDIDLSKPLTTNQLIKHYYNSGGFTAKKLAEAVDIFEKMIKDQKCTTILSFPACIISTGTRGVVKELVKQKLVDVVITTCGTLDHDLARVYKPYYHGSFQADDKKLHQEGINRLGNIFIPLECYGTVLEEKMQPILKKLYQQKKKWSTMDIIHEFGKSLESESNKKESILYWASKNNIPIIVPGITDGAFGSQLWMYYQEHKDFTIDLFADEHYLSDIMFTSKKLGACIIGGGISKHHVIWWAQFKDGLDYAVYLTTAVEYDGSLSGARLREAVSWGKVKENASHATVDGDATVLLPLICSAVLERIQKP